MAEIRKGPFLKTDWGHFADMIAIRMRPNSGRPEEDFPMPIPEVLFVQATGWGDVRTRERKVLAAPDAYDCVYAGCRIEVWGWHREKEEPKIIELNDLSRYEPLPYGHPERP